MKNTKTQDYQTKKSERFSYWSYFIGQNFSYALMVLILPSFMLMIGIDVKKIAAAMLIIKFWDALNDTIFGVIFDKVKFKNDNKCIPWLKVSAIFIPIASFVMYLVPSNASENMKLVWFIVSYVLWDSAYTLSDVPIYSFVSCMTSNLIERNSILSIGRIFATGAAGLAFLVTTILVSEKVGISFTVAALIFSVGIAVTMAPICFVGKERVRLESEEEKSYTFKSMLKYLKTNKYLLYYFAAYIISGALSTSGALELFVSYYLFGSALFSTLIMAISALPMAIVAIFINKLLVRFDKFRLFRNCVIISTVLSIFIYFIGYKNMYVYIFMIILRSVPVAITGILGLTFTPDCVEYGRYKTGLDARGIAFAVQSFAAKFSTVSQSLGFFIIGLFGWIAIEASSFAELEIMSVTQPQSALTGLWFTYTLVPAIGGLLALIPYFLYKLNDKDVQIMAKYNAGEISKDDAEKSLSRKYCL